MIIRSEQMTVFEDTAEDNFAKRLAKHLRENYSEALVRLPKKESTVDELPEQTLLSLVKKSIKSARSYDLTFESSISAFSAVMFEVAPNFDEHNMSQLCLKDKNIDPNERLDEVLKLLTDDHWEKIRNDYDPNAWKDKAEETEDAENVEKAEETVMNLENAEKPQTSADNIGLDQTMMNPANMGNRKEPVNLDNINFDETVMDFEKPEVPKEPVNINDINFDETMMDVGQANKMKEPTNINDTNFDETMVNAESMEKPKGTVNLDDINFDETMMDFEKAKKASKFQKDEDVDLDETIMNIDPSGE